MNETLSLPQIIARIAQLTGADEQTVGFFVKEFIESLETSLSQGQSVKLKNFGHFFATTNDIRFIPDSSLAEAVNQPFAAFEAIELPDYIPEDTLVMLNAMSEMHAKEEAKAKEEDQIDILDELGIPSQPYELESVPLEEKSLSEALKEIQGGIPSGQKPAQPTSKPTTEPAANQKTEPVPTAGTSGMPTHIEVDFDFDQMPAPNATPSTNPTSSTPAANSQQASSDTQKGQRAVGTSSSQNTSVNFTVEDTTEEQPKHQSPVSDDEPSSQHRIETPREVLFFFDLEPSDENHKPDEDNANGQGLGKGQNQNVGSNKGKGYEDAQASEEDQTQSTQRGLFEGRPPKPSKPGSSGAIIDWESISNISTHPTAEEDHSSEAHIVTDPEYDSPNENPTLDMAFGPGAPTSNSRKNSRTISFDDNDEEGLSVDIYGNDDNEAIHYQDEDRIPSSSDDGYSPLLVDEELHIYTDPVGDEPVFPTDEHEQPQNSQPSSTTDSYTAVENASESQDALSTDDAITDNANNIGTVDNVGSEGYVGDTDYTDTNSTNFTATVEDTQSQSQQNDLDNEPDNATSDSREALGETFNYVSQDDSVATDTIITNTPATGTHEDNGSAEMTEEEVVVVEGHYFEDEQQDNQDTHGSSLSQGFAPISDDIIQQSEPEESTHGEEVSSTSDSAGMGGPTGYGYGSHISGNRGRLITDYDKPRPTPQLENPDNESDDEPNPDNNPEEPKINPWRRWAIVIVLGIIILCGCMGLLSKCGCNVLPFLAPPDTIVVEEILEEPTITLYGDDEPYDTSEYEQEEITDEDGEITAIEEENEIVEDNSAAIAREKARLAAQEKAKREAEEKAKREAEEKRLAQQREKERLEAEAEWRARQEKKAEEQRLAQQKEREKAEAQKKANEKAKAAEEAAQTVDRRLANGPVQDVVSASRTLAIMAADYYGSSYYWVYIYQENPYLGNPKQIMSGTKVVIPPLSKYVKGSPKDPKNIQKAIQLAESINNLYGS